MRQLFYFILCLVAQNVFAQNDESIRPGNRRQSRDVGNQTLNEENRRRLEIELSRRNSQAVLNAFPVTIPWLRWLRYFRIGELGNQDSIVSVVIPGGTEAMDEIFDRIIDLGDTELIPEHLEVFARLAATAFREQNVMRFVTGSGNGIFQIRGRVQAALLNRQTNRLAEQIFEQGGARIYTLFSGVHPNNRRDLVRMLNTLLGGTSPLGLHSGSGLRSGQTGRVLNLDVTPSTRRQRGSTRVIVRLENLQFINQQAAFEAEHEFQEGVYIITGEGVYLDRLPIVNLNNQRLTDQQIAHLHQFWFRHLNLILGSGIRYVGQVGRGPNGTRILTDRAEEHRLAPIENPINRRNLALAQMNENGVRGQFHALAYDVHPEDLNVVEALVIHLTHAATDQNGLNSNIGRRSALERVRNAIRTADAGNPSETLLEVDGENNTPPSPNINIPPVRRPLFFSRSASAAPAL